MISHALTIVANEMQQHFVDAYGADGSAEGVVLGNIGEGVGANGGSGVARNPWPAGGGRRTLKGGGVAGPLGGALTASTGIGATSSPLHERPS